MQSLSHKIPYFSSVASAGLIRMTIQKRPGAIEEMERLLISHNVEIQGIQIQKTEKEKIKLEFDVLYPKKMNKPALFGMLAERDEVLSLGD